MCQNNELIYNGPYSHFTIDYCSPIEEIFGYNLVKHLSEDARVITQYTVNTICGLFIMDFVVILPSGKKIGLECDGKQYHNEYRDQWRDAMILGDTEDLTAIYRFRGCNITHNINDILCILSMNESDLFSERGRSNLNILASKDIQNYHVNHETNQFYIRLQNYGTDPISNIFIKMTHKNIKKDFGQGWQKLYEFAKIFKGCKLDTVMELYKIITENSNLESQDNLSQLIINSVPDDQLLSAQLGAGI